MSAEERQKVNPLGYEPGDIIGATGVERAWESYLRGQRGWEKRVVDARGRYRTGPEAERLLDAPSRQEPLSGRDLRLTVDIDLEQSVERAMRAHAAGSAVVVDVRTGRLLALYSQARLRSERSRRAAPVSDRIRESFNKLYTDSLRPMLDKTMRGAFQPGSTFKPFSALAALEDKIIDPARQRALRRLSLVRPPHLPLHPRAREGRHARGDRRVVQHLLLQARRVGRYGPHRAHRDRVRARPEDRASA